MKYIIVLGDGMGDYPIASLGNKTPLEAAYKPAIDALAAHGTLGRARTLYEGMPTGSDIANLSVTGLRSEKILYRTISHRGAGHGNCPAK